MGRPAGREEFGERQPILHALLGGGERVESLERYGTLAARVLMSQIFLVSGAMKALNPAGAEKEMAEHGMFWIPFFHVAAMLVELGAGLSLLLGYKARPGALMLFLFLIPVTLTFHNFWTYADPKEQKENMILFMHNLALMGGLCVALLGAGLDAMVQHTQRGIELSAEHFSHVLDHRCLH